jgi:hypothetical protein
MLPRLLPQLCLLFLSQAPPGQGSATAKSARAPDKCPMTNPSDKPFGSPYTYPAEPCLGGFWFGSDAL